VAAGSPSSRARPGLAGSTEKSASSAPLQTWALGLAGALLLVVPARRLRIDAVDCPAWPAPTTTALYMGVYLLALLCLTLCWVRSLKQARSGQLTLRGVLIGGAGLHLLSLLGLPFLSYDPLYYSAIGRAMATFHGSPYEALSMVLPPGDPFFVALLPEWRSGVSPYFPGFNGVAWAVAKLAGDDRTLHLRGYQIIGFVSILLTAVLAALAAGGPRRAALNGDGDAGGPDPLAPRPQSRAAEAAALVLLCPLALIEATLSGHNDALLAVSVALYALCLSRGRLFLAFVPLALGLSIKASAALLLLFHGAVAGLLLLRALRQRGRSTWIAIMTVGIAAGAAALWWSQPYVARYAHPLSKLIGKNTLTDYYCTRAVECLPRAFFWWVLNEKLISGVIGLVFRAAALCFLVYIAARAAKDRRYLAWSAVFVGLYYLFFHAFSQAWYLLVLLPLLPYAPAWARPALRTFCITAVTYYFLRMPFNCETRHLPLVIIEILEPMLLIFPPVGLLLRERRRAQAARGA
jgi:hypothetical protein